MLQAWRASISTPVRSTVSTWASIATKSSPISKLTDTDPTSSGWHSGIMSDVRLAAWMPATRATDRTSPFFTSRLAIAAVVSGRMKTLQRATSASVRGLFRGDVDHPGTAERVEVGERQITHVAPQVSRACVRHMGRGTVAPMSDPLAHTDPPAHTPPLPYDAISHLRTDAVRLVEIITDHGFDHDVPSCPGWTLRDLAWHVGGVWNFWGRVVAEGVTSVDVLRSWEESPRPSDAFLVDWVMAAHTSLFSALADAEPDQEVWTWTGANRDARWVERRMTQETSVHRWDASNAVALPYDIPVAVAADGVDEYLTWFAGRGATADATPGRRHRPPALHRHRSSRGRGGR